MMAALAVLVLHPVLAEPGELRVAAEGVGPHAVTWWLDGAHVATTTDREAAVVGVGAGAHVLEARTGHAGEWTAMARLTPQADGLVYVPAWTAHAGATPSEPIPAAWAPLALAAALLLRRRSKGP